MEDTTIADRIREYVLTHGGLGGKDYKESQQAMNVDSSSGTVRGMAFGGDPLDPEKDKEVSDWLAKNMGPAPATGESLPSDAPKPIDDTNENVVSSHPGAQPGELDKYIQGQEEKVGQYGDPEKQKAVYDQIINQRNSLGNRFGSGAAGLADVLVGVGGGTSNFQKNFNENRDKTQEIALQENPALQKMNLEQISAQQGLEKMRPNSILNQIMKPGLKAGFQAAFPNMSSDQIETITSNPQLAEKIMPQLVEAEKAKGELAMKDLMLKAQMGNFKETHDERKTQQEIEKEKERADILKETSKHTVLHPIEARKAQEELARMGRGNTTSLSPKDQQAIDWAKKNPKDPRAQRILNHHAV